MFCRQCAAGILIIAVSVGLILSLFFGGCGTVIFAIIAAVIGLLLLKGR